MFRSLSRFALTTAVAALSLNAVAWAQSPPTTPPTEAKPADTKPAEIKPADTKPAETKPAETKSSDSKPAEVPPTPSAPAPSPVAPGAPAPAAEAPAVAPATPAPVQTADPFGEENTLTPKQVITFSGKASWDSAFDTLMDAFKQLTAYLDKQKIKPTGNPLIVYTSTDDTGFTFLAELPIDQELKNLPKNMAMGKSPEGRALKFVHRGSYDNMDNTYEAITNHLDDKKLEAKDTFIEEYMTDPLKTAEDKLVINVFVPLK